MNLKIKTDFPIDRVNLGDELASVRDKLSKIDFTQPGIHILTLQPGSGKTYAIKELLKKQKSFLIVTSSHKLLTEEYNITGTIHWKGIKNDKLCSEYNKIKRKKELGIPIRTLCGIQGCKQAKCPYWKQFNTKKASAPFDYLQTNRVEYKSGKRKGDFKFDLLVVDESMTRSKELEFNETELKEAMDVIQTYIPTPILKKNFDILLSNPIFAELEHFLLENGNDLNNVKYRALISAINQKNEEDASKIIKLDTISLKKIIYYKTIHGVDTYSENLFYPVLDLARQGKPIIILDATFDVKQLQVLLGKYQKEEARIPRKILINKDLMPIDDIQFTIYDSSLQDKNQTIYRMNKDNLYYRKAFFDDNGDISSSGESRVKKIRSLIQAVKRKHQKVGIITYKNLEINFQDLGPTDYLGNLRGSNTIKDVDVLFIIGTPVYPPKQVVGLYKDLTLAQLEDNNVKRLTYKKIEGKHFLYDKDSDELVYNPPYDSLIKPSTDLSVVLNAYYKGCMDDIFAINPKKSVPLMDNNLNKNLPEDILLLLSQSEEEIAESYYPLYEFDFKLTEDEKYQAVHRARPFNRNQKSEIFIFGDVPQKIRDEFNVVDLDNKKTNHYFNDNYLGVYPIALLDGIQRLLTTMTGSGEIAKTLRLYKNKDKKSGYNTAFITQIKEINFGKVYEEFKKIDTTIKEGYKTVSEIKKLNPGLSVPDSIIEDCIYYAENGKFIILPPT